MARGTASPAPDANNEATPARAAAPRRLTTGAWRLAAVVAACCVVMPVTAQMTAQDALAAAPRRHVDTVERKLHEIYPDPTSAPSGVPTAPPSFMPSGVPSGVPTSVPTAVPSSAPTMTFDPTLAPTSVPTAAPTVPPTAAPSKLPTVPPTSVPTGKPTAVPSKLPTSVPTSSPTATPAPTGTPSSAPSGAPTTPPSSVPSKLPSALPTSAPTSVPSSAPTYETWPPTTVPTSVPSSVPTATPTSVPTLSPAPTGAPTSVPTSAPTDDNLGSCWNLVTGLITCSLRKNVCNSPEYTLDGGSISTLFFDKGYVDALSALVAKKYIALGLDQRTPTGCCHCDEGCNHALETGTCDPDHYADSEAKKLHWPTPAPVSPTAVPTPVPVPKPTLTHSPTYETWAPSPLGPTAPPTFETYQPTGVPSPQSTKVWVATDAEIQCAHAHYVCSDAETVACATDSDCTSYEGADEDATCVENILNGATLAALHDCAVHLYIHHHEEFVEKYGNSPIGLWDTSNVTDMSHLFENEVYFNENISGWNVDAVTSMHDMFLHAEAFDQDLDWCIEESCPAEEEGVGCVDMTDAFDYTRCILSDPPCGVRNIDGACQPTPAPTTAAPTVSAVPTPAPSISTAPSSSTPTHLPTSAPSASPTLDWTEHCATYNETRQGPTLCEAEDGCQWLEPYSRCIPDCVYGMGNKDACDQRACTWKFKGSECFECAAAAKYETCDCGDATWGTQSSAGTQSSSGSGGGRSRGASRQLKFGWTEPNTGFVVQGSVEVTGVSAVDAEENAAAFARTIATVAGGVRPADAATCDTAATTTPTCGTENQLCPAAVQAGADAQDYCCLFESGATAGAWTVGPCVPDADDITVLFTEAARRRLQYSGAVEANDDLDDEEIKAAGEAFCQESGFSEASCRSYASSDCECEWDDGKCFWMGGACSADAPTITVDYQIQVPEGADALADVWADALSSAPTRYPADATDCRGWTCDGLAGAEQQYCPQGLPGSKWSDFCCTDGKWVNGPCDRGHVAWKNTLDGTCTDSDGTGSDDQDCGPEYDGPSPAVWGGLNVTEVSAADVATKKDYCNGYCGKYWTCADS